MSGYEVSDEAVPVGAYGEAKVAISDLHNLHARHQQQAASTIRNLRAEVARLRGAATDIERLTDTYTVEGTEIVLHRIHDLRAQVACLTDACARADTLAAARLAEVVRLNRFIATLTKAGE